MTYSGRITLDVARDIAAGKPRKALDRELSIAHPESLACDVCGYTHKGSGEGYDPKNIAMNHVLAQNGHVILISASCWINHVKPQLTAKNCSNFAEVVATFGK